MKTVDELKAEIARLEKELTEAEARQSEPWPKPHKAYLHGERDLMLDDGQQLGLTGNALDHFAGGLYELTVYMLVNQDGSYTIQSVSERS